VNNAGVAGGIVNGENVVKMVRFLIVENFAIRDSSMQSCCRPISNRSVLIGWFKY